MASASEDKNKSHQDRLEILVFRDGPVFYAIPLSDIKEIINLRRIVETPFTAPFLLGLIGLHGQVAPLISPNRFAKNKVKGGEQVEYACVIESAGMEAAIACQRIHGVKSVKRPNDLEGGVFSALTVDEKTVKLINVADLLQRASEEIAEESFAVTEHVV